MGQPWSPMQVVSYTKQLFEDGCKHKGIRPRSFDQVYAVFDRDDHQNYFDALNKAKSLEGKLRNDEHQPIIFEAIVSIPSFELWLLLHYEDIQHPLHRNEVMTRLKQHIPTYTKGARDIFATTHCHLTVATQRAEALATRFNAYTAPELFTAVYKLVTLLITLSTHIKHPTK
jgi:RloB-like protein